MNQNQSTVQRQFLNGIEQAERSEASERKSAIRAGLRDIAPLLLGVVPFGLIYGVVVNSAHVSGILGQAMSTIIFAGSAQLVTSQLFGSAVPVLIVIATASVLNLRHLLYSASIAPFLQDMRRHWKLILAYLLTDEAYAIVISRFENNRQLSAHYRAWYFFAVGITLWATWHLSTGIGIFVGGQIPESWGLDFSVPLTFLALVVPAIHDRAGAAAMMVAGITVIVLATLPLKLGLLSSMLLGILTGYAVDRLVSGKYANDQQTTKLQSANIQSTALQTTNQEESV